eukprot:m.268945 g.268945  ORF g.268945 m.268945 type:complete len:783 (-) comp11081_c0_seq15:568-2916(-)
MKQPSDGDRRRSKAAWRKQLQQLTGTTRKDNLSFDEMADKARRDPELKLEELSGRIIVYRGNGESLRDDHAFVAERLAELHASKSAAMVKRVTVFCPCSILDGVVLQDVAGTDDCNPFNKSLRHEAMENADAVFVLLNKGLLATESVATVLEEELLPRYASVDANPSSLMLRVLFSLEQGGVSVPSLDQKQRAADCSDFFAEEWDEFIEEAVDVQCPPSASLRFLRFATLVLIAAWQQANPQRLHEMLGEDCCQQGADPSCRVQALAAHCANREEIDNTNGIAFVEFLEQIKRAKMRPVLEKLKEALENAGERPQSSPVFHVPSALAADYEQLREKWLDLRTRIKHSCAPDELQTRDLMSRFYSDYDTSLEASLSQLRGNIGDMMQEMQLHQYVDSDDLLESAAELQASRQGKTSRRSFFCTKVYRTFSKQLLSKLTLETHTLDELMSECQEEFCKGLAQVCVTFFAEFVHDSSSSNTGTSTRSSRNETDLGAIQQFVERVVHGLVLELIKAEIQSRLGKDVYTKIVRDHLVESFKRGRLCEFLRDVESAISTGFCDVVHTRIEKSFRSFANRKHIVREIWSAVLGALCSTQLASEGAALDGEAGADIQHKLQSLAGFVKQELGRESNPGRLLDQLLQQRCRAEIDLPCDFSSLLRKRRPLKLLQHCTDWSSGSDLKWLPGSAESILGPLFVRPFDTTAASSVICVRIHSQEWTKRHGKNSASACLDAGVQPVAWTAAAGCLFRATSSFAAAWPRSTGLDSRGDSGCCPSAGTGPPVRVRGG